MTTTKVKQILFMISEILVDDIVCDDGAYVLKPSEREIMISDKIKSLAENIDEFESTISN